MIFDFLRRLKGSREERPLTSEHDPVDYQGYRVQATPIKEASGWRVAGVVTLEREGEDLRHEFIRADVFPAEEDAADISLRKAKRLVDEQGERMFRERS